MNFEKFLIACDFKPRTGQLGMIESLDRDFDGMVVFQEGRQLGMTTILALYAAYHAVKKHDSRIVFVCCNTACVESTIQFIKRYLSNCKTELLVNRASQVMLQNGSKITCVSAYSSYTTRGLDIDLLVLDNANLNRDWRRMAESFFPGVKEGGKIVSDSVTFNLDWERTYLRADYD